jgi:hypothetical protein
MGVAKILNSLPAEMQFEVCKYLPKQYLLPYMLESKYFMNMWNQIHVYFTTEEENICDIDYKLFDEPIPHLIYFIWRKSTLENITKITRYVDEKEDLIAYYHGKDLLARRKFLYVNDDVYEMIEIYRVVNNNDNEDCRRWCLYKSFECKNGLMHGVRVLYGEQGEIYEQCDWAIGKKHGVEYHFHNGLVLLVGINRYGYCRNTFST